jgi:hypothetical protein
MTGTLPTTRTLLSCTKQKKMELSIQAHSQHIEGPGTKWKARSIGFNPPHEEALVAVREAQEA